MKEIEEIKRLHARLLGRLRMHINLHFLLVDGYSIAEVLMHDSKQLSTTVNDFLHFCYTKSSRSLFSVYVLLQENLHEDSYIILRSIYENYLHIMYVLENPDDIDDFVDSKIGVSTGRYKLKKSYAFDPLTDEYYQHGRRIRELLEKSARLEEDTKIHNVIYEYLSEYVHTHFMGIGNYLNNEHPLKFNARPLGIKLEVDLFALYFSSLLLTTFLYFEEVDPDDLKDINHNIRWAKKAMLDTCNFVKGEGKYIDLISNIKKRICMIEVSSL